MLQAFARDRPTMTLTEVARLTGMTRATARRLLLTLQELGYVRCEGREFRLTPKVLDIGYAYLSSLDLGELAQPAMEALVERTRESSSAAVLDGTEIVYVVRVPTKRVMTTALGVGSRLPAHATAMGRVLLADLPPTQFEDLFGDRELPALTPRTITSLALLSEELEDVRRQGWALVDQELELGVRAIAAPLRDRRGRVLAALNVSSNASRVSLDTLRGEFLPALLMTAARINGRLGRG